MNDFGVNSMKKHELLIPAGNMDCLRQAVYNGADAVYLACKNFGARKFAANFTNEEILDAIKFCHLYGVRIYVTMNTLVKNNEVESFLDQVRFLHKNGVDALIVQDFGMICLLREKFPNLEIHASTQANISSVDICKLYYSLGVKRVVFSRELSIDEIDNINVPIEKEAFIHGALCISYSGCCLMSSFLGGRSGNRGECAGCCRMVYSLFQDNNHIKRNQYLLSTKELNTSNNFSRLLDSSIYSFKVEGRMKGPLYVGFITRFYRRLIDGEKFNLEEETDKLKTIFNREFTKGRMFLEDDISFMNTKTPNHVGLNIGKVIDVNKNKIKIKLDKGKKLHQYDAIRFNNSKEGFVVNYLYDEKGNYISSSDNTCYVDNKINLKNIDVVSKTQDYTLQKEYEELVNKKKIPISFSIKAKIGEKLWMGISDGDNSFIEEGEVISKAISAPTDRNRIEKQISKLGNTPFYCERLSLDIDDDIFIPINFLNEMRRSLVKKIEDKRMENKNNYVEKDIDFIKTDYYVSSDKKITASVSNLEQLECCLNLDFSRIYVSNLDLYEKYKYDLRIYYMPRRCIYNINDNLRERNLVSDFANYNKKNVVGNYTLNVSNIYTAYYLSKIGINSICLSVELSEKEVSDFLIDYKNKFGNLSFEVLVYGLIEVMIIKGNILNIKENLHNYYLTDSKKRKFPVFYDGINTHILNYEKINNTYMKNRNIILRFDFYDENVNDIKSIVKKFE